MILLLVMAPAVYADVVDYRGGDNNQTEEGSLIEELISLPINGLYNALMLLGLKGFDELIFNNEYGPMTPFNPDEWDVVMTWYNGIRDGVWVLMVIAVAVAGIRHMRSSYNPASRIGLYNSIENMVYAFAIILFMPYAVRVIFLANNVLVDFFYGIARHIGDMGEVFSLDDIETGNVLATAVIRLGYVGLLLYFNFLYLIRKFVLTSMFIITPIVAWSWTISGRKEGIGVVIGEVASNAFMQAAHALVLSMYLTLIAKGISTDFSPWWAQIFGMVCLIPTANAIRNLLQGWLRFLGVNEEKWAGLATMGLMGFAGLVNIGKTAVAPKPSASFLNTGGGGGSSGSGGGSGGSPVSPISSGMRVGSAAGSVGGFIGKAAGTVMSLPLAASPGAREAFSKIGERLGSAAGTVIGRQIGTGGSIIKTAMDNSRKTGEGFAKSLGKTVGVNTITSPSDYIDMAGRVAGATLGAAFGERGAELGMKAGGPAVRVASYMLPMITTDPDVFRWR
jgi:hypothetical protein